MKLRLYSVQLDIQWENAEANFRRVQKLLDEARPEPDSLIVLPEMFPTGFSKNLSITLEQSDGPTAQFLRAEAIKRQCAIMGGLVLPGADGKGRNVSLTFSPGGELLAEYTKQQPFSLGGELTVHDAATETVLFDYQGFKIAPTICYDLRFPELYRRATAAGAEVLVNIASWPIKRVAHWLTLLQARAIENLAWVIGVNRCGTDPEFVYPGRSVVIDPHGNVVTEAGSTEQVVCSVLDKEVLDSWRTDFPALRDAKWT
jgi:omega-amidase